VPDYNRTRAMARRLLSEYDGRSTAMYLSRDVGGAISSTTGAYVAGTTTTYNVTGIVGNYSMAQVNGVSIMSGDLRVVITDEVIPAKSDSIVIDGNSYSLININTVNVGGTILLYILQVRR